MARAGFGCDPAAGARGISAFVVEKSDPGVGFGAPEKVGTKPVHVNGADAPIGSDDIPSDAEGLPAVVDSATPASECSACGRV